MSITNKQNIYNLKELIANLSDKPDITSFKDVLAKIRFSYKEIEPLCFWDADNLTEISIDENNQYSLKLVCWEKGQQTPAFVNNHKEAWVYVLKGELLDKVYEESTENDYLTLPIKKFIDINNSGCKHKLSNVFDGRSVSLHLYTT